MKLRIPAAFMLAIALFPSFPGQSLSAQALERSGARADGRCGPFTVRGTYSAVYEGTAYQNRPTGVVAVATAYLGLMTIDPDQRSLTGVGTVSVEGETMNLELLDGVVDVRPDCTAEVSYRLWREVDSSPAPVPVVERWVILEGGDRIRAIITEFPFAQHVTLGTFERLSKSARILER